MTETTPRQTARQLLKPLFLRPCSPEERAVCDAVENFIERQQKAIDLLLTAIEPFAETVRFFSDEGFTDDEIDKILLGSNIAPAHLRAARSAKEDAERILKERK